MRLTFPDMSASWHALVRASSFFCFPRRSKFPWNDFRKNCRQESRAFHFAHHLLHTGSAFFQYVQRRLGRSPQKP